MAKAKKPADIQEVPSSDEQKKKDAEEILKKGQAEGEVQKVDVEEVQKAKVARGENQFLRSRKEDGTSNSLPRSGRITARLAFITRKKLPDQILPNSSSV